MTKELKNSSAEKPNNSHISRQNKKEDEKKNPVKVSDQSDSSSKELIAKLGRMWNGLRIKDLWNRLRKSDSSPKQEEPVPTSGRVRIRLIPIWLRVLIVLLLIIIAAIFGAMFGYSVIGDGDSSDVFKKETWQHIFDIMNGVE